MNGGYDPNGFQGWFKAFEYALFGGLIVAFGFLVIMAFKIRYFEFVQKHPLRFFVELAAFSILPAIPLWLFMATRGVSKRNTSVWFVTLWLKFALLHILFEFSGVYQFYFGNLRM